MRAILWGITALCYIIACVQDLRTCRVVNLLWWISGAAGTVLLLLQRNGRIGEALPGLLFFICLQQFLFSRMYGRADCHAFSVCALPLASLVVGLRGYLEQMLLAFLFLAIVQFFRKNIAENGNLKRPVPFLPYITLAFFLVVCYHTTVT